MRHLLVLFVAVLSISLQAGADVTIPDAQVTVLNPDGTGIKCKFTSRVACTTFRTAYMSCKCGLKAGGWAIQANVSATPVTYLTNVSLLRHEKLHVNDFRYYLGKHVEALEAKRFTTRPECDAFAVMAMNAFTRTFQSVARISTVLRDGKRIDTSEDHLIVMKAEIVPELVNDRLADLANNLPAAASYALYGTAEDGYLIGQHR